MLPALSDKLRRSTLLRYIFIGGISYALELTVLLGLIYALHIGAPVAVTLGFWFGLIISFILQKFFAFKDSSLQLNKLSTQTLYYSILVVVNYLFTVAFTTLLAPIISVVIARTLALIITTIWNYVVYKKIIFNTSAASLKTPPTCIKNLLAFNKVHPLTVPAILAGGFLMSSLILMATLNNMVADDYSYFSWIRELETPFHYISQHYMAHNGRLAQASFVAFSYTLFGEAIITLIPLFIVGTLSLSLAWLVNLIITFKNNQKITSAITGTLLATTIIFMMPSLFDSLLWTTSSTVYMLSIIGLIVNTCLAITLRNKLKKGSKVQLIVLLPVLLCVLLSQSFSEPTSAIAIGLAVLWLLYEIYKKNKRQSILALQMLSALAVGFLLVYLSPGTRARQSALSSSSPDLHFMIFNSFEHFAPLFRSLELWMIGLVFFTAAFIALNIKKRRDTRLPYIPLTLIALIVFGSFTYGAFFVNNYAANCCALRSLSLPTTGIVLSFTILMVVLLYYLLSVARFKHKELLLSILAVLVLIPSMLGATKLAVNQIRALSVRDTAVTIRQMGINEQLNSKDVAKTKKVSVQATPVITKSQAIDINEPNLPQTDWLIRAFQSYYHIPKDYTMTFIPTPNNYCTNNETYNREEYVCR